MTRIFVELPSFRAAWKELGLTDRDLRRLQEELLANPKVGSVMQVICDGYDDENDLYLCRSRGDAPEIDSEVCVASEEPLYPGNFYTVCIKDSDVYDLYGELTEEAQA